MRISISSVLCSLSLLIGGTFAKADPQPVTQQPSPVQQAPLQQVPVQQVSQEQVPAQHVVQQVVTQQELVALYQQIVADESPQSIDERAAYPVGWYCVAAPFGNLYNGYTWWLSPNLQYSRYMALNSCTRAYGYVCAVDCRWQF